MADTLSYILLFNDKRYQRCNLGVGQRLFRYDHLAGDRLVGTLSGVVEDGVLDCGHSAPFGGVDWVRRREPVGSIVGLIRAAAARARPAYFGANETAAEFALVGLGATIESCEISLGIEVWRYRTPDEYIAALRSFGRNRLRHGLCAGTVICPAESAGDWAACYELLAKTKQ